MSKKTLFRQSVFLGFLILRLNSIAGEILPSIDARRFDSKVIQRSTTGRIYLFSTDHSKLPQTGAILLAHEQDKPIFAFKVIRTDSNRSEFIAKRIRRYDQTKELQLNQSYLMMEKVADVLPPPDTLSPPDKEAVYSQNNTPAPPPISQERAPPVVPSENQVASAEINHTLQTPNEKVNAQQKLDVNHFDSELDSGTSNNDAGWNEEDYYSPNEAEERQILSPFENGIGAMLGIYRNLSNYATSGAIYGGFSIFYSRAIGRDIFLFSKTPQDAVHLELSLGYYNIQNLEPLDDAYTIMPFTAQLRYDLQFSHTFALFAYGGIQYNAMVANTNGVQKTADQIQGIQSTVGIGMLYTLGPHWLLRVDLGWDKMAAGLTLQW